MKRSGTPWLSVQLFAESGETVPVSIDDYAEENEYSEPTFTGGDGVNLPTAVPNYPNIDWTFPQVNYNYTYGLYLKVTEPLKFESFEANVHCVVDADIPWEYVADSDIGECEPLCEEFYELNCVTGECEDTLQYVSRVSIDFGISSVQVGVVHFSMQVLPSGEYDEGFFSIATDDETNVADDTGLSGAGATWAEVEQNIINDEGGLGYNDWIWSGQYSTENKITGILNNMATLKAFASAHGWRIN